MRASLHLSAALAFALSSTVVGAQIELIELESGLQNPVGVTNAGDGSNRLFIVGQRGTISIWQNGQISGEFLDIESRVNFGGERGLLGLAFHPDYAANGEFYVHYSANGGGDTVISRFLVTGNPDVADPNSEEILLQEDQPFSNHNGGQINFGPDGYLYIGLGDGGSANDPGNRAQDLDELLGKILRIDVDNGSPYGIPPTNPFVGVSGRDEIWAYGLRNPWRFSFDRDTGDMIIGDVGQNQIEEIDLQPGTSAGGENYGWRRMEGSDCFDPPQNCNNGTLVLPIIEYNHFGQGPFKCSVTGGYRYRGSAYPDLEGTIIFGDYCSGEIFGGIEQPDGSWTMPQLLDTTHSITSFGEDENGELYMVEEGGRFFAVQGEAVIEAFCETEMTQGVYTQGQTVTIDGQRVTNPANSIIEVQVQVGIRDPNNAPIPVVNAGPITLAGGFDQTFGPIEVFTVDGNTELGEYTSICRIVDPDSGEVAFQAETTFEVQ